MIQLDQYFQTVEIQRDIAADMSHVHHMHVTCNSLGTELVHDIVNETLEIFGLCLSRIHIICYLHVHVHACSMRVWIHVHVGTRLMCMHTSCI